MTEITYQITAEDIASKSLRVTVPVEQLAEAERRAIKDYARNVRLPGFRKGQAPEAIVRRRFGTEIKRYTLEEGMRMGWEKALTETGLKPVSEPQVRNVTFEEGQPLGFDVTVDVRPELKLGTTGGFSLTRNTAAVNDEAITQQIDQLREQKAAWEAIEGDKPGPGNLVNVSVTTLENGEVVNTGEPYEFVIGQGRAIPALEEKIMTLQAGETDDADLRYPDDHPDEAKRGTARQVRVTLHGAKRQHLPPLDDAFAREVGDFDGVDALRAAVREDLQREATRSAEMQLREELIGKIAEANSVPAPHSLTHRLMHAYADAYRIEPGQLEAFEQSFHTVAEAQVRRELILEAVTTAQNLRATEADLDAKVAELAAARGVDAGKLYASLQQGNRLGELERSITEERVFAWLFGQSTVTEGTA